MVTHVVGIDPGLVHTGVVSMVFIPPKKKIYVNHEVIVGTDAALLKGIVGNWDYTCRSTAVVFIEGYKPRSNFGTDLRMVKAVNDCQAALPNSKVLNNMGVKKVVKRSFMELLGVWSFSTTTHHQDLRSAARIALLGMLKDDTMNQLLADVVRDHLEGSDWSVVH